MLMFFDRQRRSDQSRHDVSSGGAALAPPHRRPTLPLQCLRVTGVCLVVMLYLSLFVYLEGDDMSYERVVAVHTAEKARVELEREQDKLRRAKEKEEQASARTSQTATIGNSERSSDGEGEVPIWSLLLFYVLLRFWLGSRVNDANDDNNSTRESLLQQRFTSSLSFPVNQSHQQQQQQQYQHHFQVWADRLNQQRTAHGQRPLSLESLRLVLRERELNDGQDYDGLLRFNEESGPGNNTAHHPSPHATSTGAMEEEINRLPLRVVQATDDLLRPASSPNIFSSSGSARHHDSSAVSSSASFNTNNASNNHCCSVCLEGYKVGDLVRTIPCFHSFHQHCIDDWLSRKATCPVCKHSVLS